MPSYWILSLDAAMEEAGIEMRPESVVSVAGAMEKKKWMANDDPGIEGSGRPTAETEKY